MTQGDHEGQQSGKKGRILQKCSEDAIVMQ